MKPVIFVEMTSSAKFKLSSKTTNESFLQGQPENFRSCTLFVKNHVCAREGYNLFSHMNVHDFSSFSVVFTCFSGFLVEMFTLNSNLRYF